MFGSNTYKINAGFAISKAEATVANWTAGVAKAERIGTPDQIAFARESLAAARANLDAVRQDVKENWTAYV